ncbi:hypothetical protein PTKIN_Ptkin03bG0158300 [Pterospermum kingtungense]
MERKLYDAAVEGSVISLLNLLREDALLLDIYITGRYPETPLHVASMLGHEKFVEQLLTRKPELARELDYRNLSPLHLAAAKGYLGIVNRLLQVNPDMCLVCDLDGRNPPHIAASKEDNYIGFRFCLAQEQQEEVEVVIMLSGDMSENISSQLPNIIDGPVPPSSTQDQLMSQSQAQTSADVSKFKRRPLRPRSRAWEHFTKFSNDQGEQKARCNYCEKEF